MSSINPYYLLDNERHIQCRFLSASAFVTFCKERGVRTSSEQLERFEKLGLIYPLFRVEYPPLREKIEYVDEGRAFNVIGLVEEGEEWSGDTRDGYGYFEFSERFVQPFREAGLLWVPGERPFAPWDGFTDKDGYTKCESFYSTFQILDVQYIRTALTAELSLDAWGDTWDADTLKNMFADRDARVASLKANWQIGKDVAFVCQAISNRYYPHTQSDRRTIRISSPTRYHDWDWHEYRSKWDPKSELQRLGMSAEKIKRLAEYVADTASSIDPLKSWYALVTFVSITKKEKLKDKALLAQTLYAAARMLRLFYQDLTGVELPPPDESATWKKDFYYGEGVTSNPQQYLEFLANEYHLNPRPRLILVVEGDGEEELFPVLAEKLFGSSFLTLGVEVYNLRGIGNFGGRRDLLRAFIDDHHHRNTIVFVVLDNEGQARNAREKLLSATSNFTSGRKVTTEDYVHVWDRCVELDNFTNEEIVLALSIQSGGRQFRCEDMQAIRERFRTKEDKRSGLERLFHETTGRNLSKRDMLKALSDMLTKSVIESGEVTPSRPIEKLLERIIHLASMNHRPHALDTWQKNQRSGYFGSVLSPSEEPDGGKFIVDG